MRQELGTNIQENSSERHTDNKEDQISLPYNTELLSILKDAVIISDENFKIIYWNPAAEEIYGWKSSGAKQPKNVLRTKFIGNKKPKTFKELNETGSYEDEFLQFTKILMEPYIYMN